MTAMWDFLWRFDTGDAVYAPPGTPVIGGAATDSRFIGHSISILGEYEISERLRFFAAFTHFDAGPAVTRGGGRDVQYFLSGIEWSF